MPTGVSALTKGSVAILIGMLLVILAYWYIDKPVVFWVNAHPAAYPHFLIACTRIPEVLVAIILVLYPILVIRFCLDKYCRLDRVLLAAANSVAITIFLDRPLKILFGRYWPATWINHNPSLLRDHVYGFHWLHFGTRYAAFPSGHTAATLAVTAIIWMAYPAWRWLAVVLSCAVAVGLVGMNYHFVGDVIGGAFFGAGVAFYTAKMMGIENK